MSSGKTYVLRRGMTGVPNRTVYDDRLSYQALGVLTVLLARPDGSPSGYRALEGRGLGQQAMLAALRELDGAGYRHLIRRHGARGRLMTDVVVSEVPITPEEAAEQLDERLGTVALLPVDKSATVRRNPTHGATSGNGASSQVAPRGASPGHGGPRHGEPPHIPTGSKVTTHFVRSDRGDQARECAHGDPKGPEHCALCRRGLLPGVAPWDAEPLDPSARAAGAHLEVVR